MNDEIELSLGNEVGNWRVIDYGDDGAYGIIYKVRSKRNPNLFGSLKVCKFKKGPYRDLFVSERRNMAQLSDCPHVVKYLDEGDYECWPFYIMDWCETFEGRLPLRKGEKLALDFIEGCIEIADKGFLHNDIKPGNLALCEDRGVVIDLGASCRKSEANLRNVNSGTFGYKAPEVARYGQRSEASDVHSLAVTLFEILPLTLVVRHFVPLALAWQPFSKYRPQTLRQFRSWYVWLPKWIKAAIRVYVGIAKTYAVAKVSGVVVLLSLFALLAYGGARVVILLGSYYEECMSLSFEMSGRHFYAQGDEKTAFEDFEKAASYSCCTNREVLLYLAHCYRTNNVVEPNEEDAKYYEDRAYGRPATRRPFWKRKKPPSLK